jgi:iron complex outermembrane recepter protein
MAIFDKHILTSERHSARRRMWIFLVLAIAMQPLSGRAQETAPAPQPSATAPGKSGDLEKLLDMPLDQLAKTPVTAASAPGPLPSMDTPVTSVNKEAGTIGRSAAAVFVITNEMIRRSGATCIPEALRMAPGLEVARVNSNTWAITARGFNNAFANKLLVLIDGRTVYVSAFSGVYWDCEDVLLEDVDRIEVIRGPGGTLWGANAVNGVINIITKSAKDTKGSYISGGGGTYERSMGAARYGGDISDDCQYRVYAKYNDRGPFYNADGQPDLDPWTHGQAGFRSDWNMNQAKTDTLTFQGDHYVGNSGMSAGLCRLAPEPFQQTLYGTAYNTGDNVLGRWRHQFDDESDLSVQTYFDNFERTTFLNSTYIKTWDIELQYRFPLNDWHQITCGAGYRHIDDELPTNNAFTLGVIPVARTTYISNQFIQDEITLSPDLLQLILGCKLEQNSYTYFEYQPSIRALYTPDKKHTLWGAVSRAVHTPSRVDENLFATSEVDFGTGPTFLRSIGNPDELSETLMAYEVGWREQMTDKFSYDLATFYNSYDSLRTLDNTGFSPGPPTFFYYQFGNAASAQSYGVELATTYKASERWNLYVQYTYLQMHVYDDPGDLLQGDGNSPCNQVYLRSSWNVAENVDFDLMGRYVDRLVGLGVPSYIEMDLRLAWRPKKHLELAVIGQNLLQTYHYEFGRTTETFNSILDQTPRGVYGTVAWRY